MIQKASASEAGPFTFWEKSKRIAVVIPLLSYKFRTSSIISYLVLRKNDLTGCFFKNTELAKWRQRLLAFIDPAPALTGFRGPSKANIYFILTLPAGKCQKSSQARQLVNALHHDFLEITSGLALLSELPIGAPRRGWRRIYKINSMSRYAGAIALAWSTASTTSCHAAGWPPLSPISSLPGLPGLLKQKFLAGATCLVLSTALISPAQASIPLGPGPTGQQQTRALTQLGLRTRAPNGPSNSRQQPSIRDEISDVMSLMEEGSAAAEAGGEPA